MIISDPQHGHLRMRHTRLPPDRSGLARRTLITAGMNRPAQISRRPHSAHNVRLTDLNTQAPSTHSIEFIYRDICALPPATVRVGVRNRLRWCSFAQLVAAPLRVENFQTVYFRDGALEGLEGAPSVCNTRVAQRK